MELHHHGIKGQKWGVRRYQNPDGSLTLEGRKRLGYRNRTIKANTTKENVEEIISTMSAEEKKKLCLDKDGLYLTTEQGSAVVKRVLLKDGKKPISFIDLLEDGDNLNIALGTRSEKRYRGKGYASTATKKAMDWVNSNSDKIDQTSMVWGVRVDNLPSIKIAEDNGFVIDPDSYSDDKQWVNYVKKIS